MSTDIRRGDVWSVDGAQWTVVGGPHRGSWVLSGPLPLRGVSYMSPGHIARKGGVLVSRTDWRSFDVLEWERVPDGALVCWWQPSRNGGETIVAVLEAAIRRGDKGEWVVTADDGYEKRPVWPWSTGNGTQCEIVVTDAGAATMAELRHTVAIRRVRKALEEINPLVFLVLMGGFPVGYCLDIDSAVETLAGKWEPGSSLVDAARVLWGDEHQLVAELTDLLKREANGV